MGTGGARIDGTQRGLQSWGASPHTTPAAGGKGTPGLLKVGTCCRLALRRPEVHAAVPSPARLPEGRHSLAGLVQKAPRGALAAHEDVLLQRLLMEHPVAHAEGGVTCRKAKGQCGPACLKPSTAPITSL